MRTPNAGECGMSNPSPLTVEQRRIVVHDVFETAWGCNNAHEYRKDLRSYELSLRAVEKALSAAKLLLEYAGDDALIWEAVGFHAERQISRHENVKKSQKRLLALETLGLYKRQDCEENLT